MNAVEIEQAISELVAQPFHAQTFPYDFLEAFGNKETTIKQLKAGTKNKSDVPNGVLQINNIHLATSALGKVNETFSALRQSSANKKNKVKFILATDGEDFQAEDLINGDTLACAYRDFPDHFGFFLALAGISVVKQIREESFDIRATSRLNRLYTELLKDNPDWVDLRHEMNHFLARLIFCFYAEDTHIFRGDGLFTATIDQMSAKDGSNTAWVISEVFRAMNTKPMDHAAAGIRPWASQFPYVNGGLFSGSVDVPNISKVARTYLLHIGNLDWQKINPDIFGSMIQAVADEEERGALGMHYTSRPNILKVLNPLFLDDLRTALEAAGKNTAKLKALRQRISKIRVFDPACGSGNFLVIAYKELRAIESEINNRLSEVTAFSHIPLPNFRGIELRDFAAEIARLALIIAEYQCDVQYLGEKLALDSFLPLDSENWITQGNALRLDWLSICPPTGKAVKLRRDDMPLLPVEGNQTEMDFQNEGGETYICGNPPYVGDKKQTKEQKADIQQIFEKYTKSWKSLDYVSGWFMKAADYGTHTNAASAFVSTNSICQGQQVPILWPLIFKTEHEISFAYTSFKWTNLASHNAGVTVIIVGLSKYKNKERQLFTADHENKSLVIVSNNITPYLAPGKSVFIKPRKEPLSEISEMLLGNFAKDGGHLILDRTEVDNLDEVSKQFIRPMFGGEEFIKGNARYCFWIEEKDLEKAQKNPHLQKRFKKVEANRLISPKKETKEWAKKPYRFVEIRSPSYTEAMILPIVSSENREYFPVGLLPMNSIVNYAFALYDAPLWNLALIASRLHLVWIATVCGKLETRYRYSNTLGWNTFPVPFLTQKNKDDLTRCAENILIERERHFPATIADLYDPKAMPEDLRRAHDWNDEVLERIYIGRRFKNDTERLERLFSMYTEMTTKAKNTGKAPHHDVL